MAVYKKVNLGNYNLIVSNGNVVVESSLLTITGNLEVQGNIVNYNNYVEPYLVLNGNLDGNSSPYSGLSGIKINRGSESNVEITWNETGTFANSWTLTDNTSTVGYILTSNLDVKLAQITNNPIGVSDYIVLAANTAEVGQTGLFVNTGSTSSELVNTRSAKKFAIIFG